MFYTHNAEGKEYLNLVDGEHALQAYSDADGWTTPTITGVDSSLLSYAAKSGYRTWYVERNSTNAWYSSFNAAWGELKKFPLASVFDKGGNLLFVTTWSTSDGSGLNERTVFVTDRGQVAVYRGTDPSDPADASAWSLDAIYDVGVPLSKHMHAQHRGDLLIATRHGLESLADAAEGGGDGYGSSLLTRHWRDSLGRNPAGSRWRMLAWTGTEEILFIYATAAPDSGSPTSQVYGVNLDTRAWFQVTGWDVQSMAVLGDELYFGTTGGLVERAWTGGRDGDQPIRCAAVLSPVGQGDSRKKTLRTLTGVVDTVDQVELGLGVVNSLNTPLKYPDPPTFEESGFKWGDRWLNDEGEEALKWGGIVYADENPTTKSQYLPNVGKGSETATMPYLTMVVNSARPMKASLTGMELEFSVSKAAREVSGL